MQAPDIVTQGIKHWLYDWGGANVDLFLGIQRTLADGWIWLPEFLSAVGSYWGAPAVVVLFLVWGRISVWRADIPLRLALGRFALGLPLSFAAAALAKTLFALPRPFVLLGDSVYRAASAPDSRYTKDQWGTKGKVPRDVYEGAVGMMSGSRSPAPAEPQGQGQTFDTPAGTVIVRPR